MTLAKTFFIVATAGFLSACEEPVAVESMPGAAVMRGTVDASLVSDPALASRLDGASQAGNLITYAYYTDVVGEVAVIGGADALCGGAGKATLNVAGAGLSRTQKEGRGYNIMTFACRS